MPKLGKIHNPKGCLWSGADQIPPSDLVKIALKLLKFLLFLSCPNCAQSWGRLRISIRLSRSEIKEIKDIWSWLLQNLPQWLLWVPQLSGWVGDLQNPFCELPLCAPSWGRHRISIRLSRSEIREIREVWSWLLQNLPQWLLWVPQLSGWVGDLQNTFCELPQLCPKLGQA